MADGLDFSSGGTPVELPDFSGGGTRVDGPDFAAGGTPVDTGGDQRGIMQQAYRGFLGGLAKENPAMLGAFMEAVRRKTGLGSETVEQWLKPTSEAEQTYKPAIDEPFQGGVGDFFEWLSYQVGGGAASTVPPLVGGVAGAVGGAAIAGPAGAGVGAVGGALLPSYVLNTGDTFRQLTDEKVDPDTAAGWALALGAPLSGLDLIGLSKVTGVGQGVVKREIMKAIAHRLKEGTLGEATTEAAQQILQESAAAYLTGNPNLGDRAKNVGLAALVGGATGGVMGGGIEAGSQGARAVRRIRTPAGEPVETAPDTNGTAAAQGLPDTIAPEPAPVKQSSVPSGARVQIQPEGWDAPVAGKVVDIYDQDGEVGIRVVDAEGRPIYDGPLADANAVAAIRADVANTPDVAAPVEETTTPGAEGLSAVRPGKQAARPGVPALPDAGAQPGAAAPAQPDAGGSTGLAGIGAGIAGGIRDGAIDSIWQSTQTGKWAIAPEKAGYFEQTVDRLNKAGAIKSRDDVARLYDAGIDSREKAQAAVASFQGGTAVAPTPAQKEAGNYAKRKIKDFPGLPISIETEQGQQRTGTDAKGKPWSVTMPAPYGYILGTEGADGDHFDVYVGPNPEAPMAYVIDQVDADTGKFDEHKALIGFDNLGTAVATYERGFSDGKGAQRLGAITPMPMDAFKAWVKNGKTRQPLAPQRRPGSPQVSAAPAATPEGAAQPAAIQPPQTGPSRDQIYDLVALGYDRTAIEAMSSEQIQDVVSAGKRASSPAPAGAPAAAAPQEGAASRQAAPGGKPAPARGSPTEVVDSVSTVFPDESHRELYRLGRDLVGRTPTAAQRKTAERIRRDLAPWVMRDPEAGIDWRTVDDVFAAARDMVDDVRNAVTQAKAKGRRDATIEPYVDPEVAVEYWRSRQESAAPEPTPAKGRKAEAAEPQGPTPHYAGYGTPKQQESILQRARKRFPRLKGDLAVRKVDGRAALVLKGGTAEDNAKIAKAVDQETQSAIRRSEAARARKRKPPQKDYGLLGIIAREGGIVDTGGELKGMDLGRWHVGKTGMPKLVRSPASVGQQSLVGGKGERVRDADYWGEKLEEMGYLPPQPEGVAYDRAKAALALISRAAADPDFNMRPGAFGTDPLEDDQDAIDRNRDEMEAMAGQLGVDAEGLDDAQLAAALASAVEAAENPDVEMIDRIDDAIDTLTIDIPGFESNARIDEAAAAADEEIAEGGGGPVAAGADPREGQELGRGVAEPGERARSIDKIDAGDQRVIPGAERISDKDFAERQGQGRLKGKKPQQAADDGLFDTGARNQTDLMDLVTKDQRPLTPTAEKAMPKIATDLDALGKRMFGENFSIAVAPDREMLGGALGRMVQMDGGLPLVLIAMRGAGQPSMMNTLGHEGIHYLRAVGAIDDKAWAQLEKQAATWRETYDIDGRYPELDIAARNEEAIAEAFGDYLGGTRFDERTNGILAKLKEFLQRAWKAISGRGIQSIDDLFSQIEQGQLAARADAAALELTESETLALEQAAYHGTPHDFETFSLDKIGTGEGAQVYGWGLYFAGKKSIAEWYRKTLSSKGKTRQLRTPDGSLVPEFDFSAIGKWAKQKGHGDDMVGALAAEMGNGFTIEQIRDDAREQARKYPNTDHADEMTSMADMIDGMIKDGWRTVEEKSRGRLYHVDLAPADEEYLDLDAPLAQQSEKVKEALAKIPQRVWDAIEEMMDNRGMAIMEPNDDTYTGNELRQALTRFASEDALFDDPKDPMGDNPAMHVSNFLRHLGIPGNRYHDASSRTNANIKQSLINSKQVGIIIAEQRVEELRADIQKQIELGGKATERAEARLGTAEFKLSELRRELQEFINEKPTYNYVLFDDSLVQIVAKEQRQRRQMDNAIVQAAQGEKGLAKIVRPVQDFMADLWKGTKIQPGEKITIQQQPGNQDMNVFQHWFFTALDATKGFAKDRAIVQRHMDLEQAGQAWAERLNAERARIYQQMEKENGKASVERVETVLWDGEVNQKVFTPAELAAGGLTPSEAGYYQRIRKLWEKEGRLLDQHERQMMPAVRAEREAARRKMVDLTERHGDVTGRDLAAMLNRRQYLKDKIRRGEGDPATMNAELTQIDDRIDGIQFYDPQHAAEFKDQLASYVRANARLLKGMVRTRQGYMAHRFIGSWRLFQETGVDAQGQPILQEITSDDGFYDTQSDALKAARNFLKTAPAAKLTIEPKMIKWPESMVGTELSYMDYGRMVSRLEKTLAMPDEMVREMLQGIARVPNARRWAGFKQRRVEFTDPVTGEKQPYNGWLKDTNRALALHTNSIVRYIVTDKMKHDVVKHLERERMSPARGQSPAFPTRQKFWEGYLRDILGRKQPIEREIDALLDKPWLTPARGAIATGTLAGVAMGSLSGNPYLGVAFGGYIGRQIYMALEKGRDFKTRALTAKLGEHVAMAKLGGFTNIASALVNLGQNVNTYAVLGGKYWAKGTNRAANAAPTRLSEIINTTTYAVNATYNWKEVGLTDGPVDHQIAASMSTWRNEQFGIYRNKPNEWDGSVKLAFLETDQTHKTNIMSFATAPSDPVASEHRTNYSSVAQVDYVRIAIVGMDEFGKIHGTVYPKCQWNGDAIARQLARTEPVKIPMTWKAFPDEDMADSTTGMPILAYDLDQY